MTEDSFTMQHGPWTPSLWHTVARKLITWSIFNWSPPQDSLDYMGYAATTFIYCPSIVAPPNLLFYPVWRRDLWKRRTQEEVFGLRSKSMWERGRKKTRQQKCNIWFACLGSDEASFHGTLLGNTCETIHPVGQLLALKIKHKHSCHLM